MDDFSAWRRIMTSQKKMLVPLANIKIARVSTVPFFLVTQLKQQINYLCERGGMVTVITSNIDEIPDDCFIKDVSLVEVQIRRRPNLISDLIALIRLYKFFKRNEFDIVHSTTPKAGLLVAITSWFARVPIRLHTYTGQPWVTMNGVIKFISKTSDAIIGRLNTRCYADSPSQARFLIEHNIIDVSHMHVLGSGSLAGVDLERFDCERFSEIERKEQKSYIIDDARSLVVTYVGRITIDKGIIELFDAFDLLRSAEINVELVLVGPLDDVINMASNPLYSRIMQTRGVHWAGYSDEPEKYLSFTDVICLPSYREGFGTVIIEAAAMGIPAVGTNIVGLMDAILDGVTGILVPAADSHALYEALKYLLENNSERIAFGEAARLRCQKEFGAARLCQAMEDEYLSLIESI